MEVQHNNNCMVMLCQIHSHITVFLNVHP